MPAESDTLPSHRHFPERPPEFVAKKYAETIFETGHPEDIADLHKGPILRDEGFIRLSYVSIPSGRRRDGLRAPCPRCAVNKFFDGWLVYFPRLQAVAFVGHCCAGAEQATEAKRVWDAEQADKLNQEYLLNTLPTLAERIAALPPLATEAREAGELYRAFKKLAPQAWKGLKRVATNGGILNVNEVMAQSAVGPRGITTSGGGGVQTRTVSFGSLAGRAMFKTHFDPSRTVQEAQSVLETHARNDEEQVVAYLGQLAAGDSADRAQAAKDVRDAVNRLDKLPPLLSDLRAFFAHSNLARVNDWAQHPDSPLRGLQLIRKRRASGGDVLEYVIPGEFATIPIPPGISALGS